MKKRTILLIVVMLASILLTAVVSAEDGHEVDCDHPRVVYLMEKTDATCAEVQELHSDGVGFGRILKAAIVAEGLEGFEGDWRELLEAHRDEVGWGSMARAYGLASRYSVIGRIK